MLRETLIGEDASDMPPRPLDGVSAELAAYLRGAAVGIRAQLCAAWAWRIPVLLTRIAMRAIIVAIIARIAALEAERVADQDELVLYWTQTDARFGATDAAVAAESTARSNADAASASASTRSSRSIPGRNRHATDTIAQLDERLAVQFDGT